MRDSAWNTLAAGTAALLVLILLPSAASAAPSANLYPGFVAVVQGATVTFLDESSSATPIVSWNWSFGDGAFSAVQIPSHTYALPSAFSSFNVTLTVCSALGCASTSQVVRLTDWTAVGTLAAFLAFVFLVLAVSSRRRRK